MRETRQSSEVPGASASLVGGEQPSVARRLAAVTAIVILVVVLGASAVSFDDDVRRFVVDAPLLLVTLFSAWYALTRVGARRLVGLVIGVAGVAALLGVAAAEEPGVRSLAVLRLGLVGLAIALARFALRLDASSAKRAEKPGRRVAAAAQPVLLINLKSGGGKAERWHLVEECRRRAIEPVVLGAGEDLHQLATQAIQAGADVIGMAGGDGSQAIVATVASDRDVPMVVVPAGTRNHLARDLGLDRDDVLGALDAFGEAVERRVSLADVNGSAFVNNVSLGLYAAIVATPEYRDAKIETTLAAIPRLLAPGTPAFPLSFAGPGGEPHDAAHLIQISNNPYRKSLQGLGSRPRLDSGQLGIVALEVDGDRAASAFIAAVTTGHPERFSGFNSWTADSFEVTSSSPIAVGLDGESMVLESPLSFKVRAGGVRVRLPRNAIGSSPAARAIDWRSAVRALWRTAMGKPVEVGR